MAEAIQFCARPAGWPGRRLKTGLDFIHQPGVVRASNRDMIRVDRLHARHGLASAYKTRHHRFPTAGVVAETAVWAGRTLCPVTLRPAKPLNGVRKKLRCHGSGGIPV